MNLTNSVPTNESANGRQPPSLTASARVELESSGVANSQLNSGLEIKLDYWHGFLQFQDVALVPLFLDFLCGIAGDNWQYTNKPFYWRKTYACGFVSAANFFGGVRQLSSGLSQVYLVLPGEWWRSFLEHEQIIRGPLALGRCTRIDIAVDDYKKRVSFDEVFEICRRDHYALVDSYKYVESSNRGSSQKMPTIYLGSPSSDKLVRFYDSDALRGDGSNRWEVQFRGARANSVSTDLADSAMNFSYLLAAYFGGSVDFIDRAQSSDYLDCSRFSWWQSLLDDLQAPPKFIKLLQKDLSLSSSKDWILRQVSPTLAMLEAIMGRSAFNFWLINKVLVEGVQRLSPRQQVLIEKYDLLLQERKIA